MAYSIDLRESMSIPKELMKNLLLLAIGCSGSYSELTNRDGTKKRNGWR
jgi:hypothetical protein